MTYMPASARLVGQNSSQLNQRPSENIISTLASGANPFNRFGAVGRVLGAPSNIMGGILESGRQLQEGTYKPPKIGPNFTLPTLRGNQKANIGEFIAPPLVGVARGLQTANPTVFEEAPKAFGVDPESGPGMAIGLAGEVATPDLLDILTVGKVGQKVLGTTGKTSEVVGATMAESGLRPTFSQRKIFREKFKQDIGEALVQEGVAGPNVAENLIKKIDDLQVAFDEVAESRMIPVNLQTLYQKFKSEIDDMGSSIFPELQKKGDRVRQVFNNLITKLRPDLQEQILSGRVLPDKTGSLGSIPLGDLTKERRLADDVIRKSQWNLPPDQRAYYSAVRKAITDAIREGAKDYPTKYGSLRELGQRLNKLYTLNDIAGAPSRSQRLYDVLSGVGGAIAGSVVGGAPGAIAGPLVAGMAQRALFSSPVVGGTSKVLSEVGKGLQNPGIIQTLGKGVLTTAKESILAPSKTGESENQTGVYMPSSARLVE